PDRSRNCSTRVFNLRAFHARESRPAFNRCNESPRGVLARNSCLIIGVVSFEVTGNPLAFFPSRMR
ncbi:MAG: hypothetical protein WA970_15250, partial [Gammaproteobacteria bacterium]